ALPPGPTLGPGFAPPYGGGGFNPAACRIAQGPDGMIYLGSGSRTDHGEAGDDPRISRLGEAPDPGVPGVPGGAGGEFTACILRLDPTRGQQAPEVSPPANPNPSPFPPAHPPPPTHPH